MKGYILKNVDLAIKSESFLKFNRRAAEFKCRSSSAETAKKC